MKKFDKNVKRWLKKLAAKVDEFCMTLSVRESNIP